MTRSNLFIQAIVAASLASALWGCGKANDAAPAIDSSGKHPAGWTTNHGASYGQVQAQCRQCHGNDLTGGVTSVSCFTASRGAQICHSTGPHVVPWLAHNTQTNLTNNCVPCHGINFGGGTVAPPCTKCHILLTPGTVPVLGQCDTCHGFPPNGAVFPNISGSHRKHTADGLNSCAYCHNGGGSGNPNHGNRQTLSFQSVYNVRGGTAVMNPDFSCSGVSCHGGIRTLVWGSGHFDTLLNCEQCHASGKGLAAPPYNSYSSGKTTVDYPAGVHAAHMGFGMHCYDCHNMTATSGANSHFSNMATPAFELEPRLTIRADTGYPGAGPAASCLPGLTPPAGRYTIGVCHTTKSWR